MFPARLAPPGDSTPPPRPLSYALEPTDGLAYLPPSVFPSPLWIPQGRVFLAPFPRVTHPFFAFAVILPHFYSPLKPY
jgi:hypothetical protein